MSATARPGGEDARRQERLRREIEHHRAIADRAEIVWNWDTPSGRERARRRSRLFVEHGRIGPGAVALELGCGTGIFLAQVAPAGARLRGLDLSPDLLARARARVAGAGAPSLDCGNAEQMPYGDQTFDTVYGSSVLHHLDLDRALREIFRVLKPGGQIVFAEPNIMNPQVAVMFHVGLTKHYFGVSPDEMAFSRFRAARSLHAAGFRDVRVEPFDFLHPSTPEALVPLVARAGGVVERLPLLREIAGSLLIRAARP
jgi:ubiquinone/menaquinone biosynthesis C-methylase UbiE